MDEKQIWLVLGIEATKEEDEIKQAYRSRLVSTNPEEDPEGFKRLRKAYEMALELAAETDSREIELPEGPVGDWLMEIRDVYNWLPSRRRNRSRRPAGRLRTIRRMRRRVRWSAR